MSSLGAVGCGNATVVEEPILPRLQPLLAADPREEGGQFEVVVGAPLFKRMMVAAGTLQPLAQEKLRGVFHLLVDVRHLPIPDHRWIGIRLAGGRDDVANKLAVGLVFRDALPDPVVEGVAAVAMQLVVGPLVAENGRPLGGEVVGVVFRVEQAVDQPIPLARIAVGEKLLRLLAGRQAACDVDRHPPEKRCVIADR